MDYYSKYLKYKNKYLDLKNKIGGAAVSKVAQKKLPDCAGNLMTNVDSAPAHIQATVQNIVLRFGPVSPIWGVTEGEVLAGSVAVESAATQSGRWCPLIWRALALCYGNVPAQLTDAYPESHAAVDAAAAQLAAIPGWCQYACTVLTQQFTGIPSGSNEFSHSYVVEQSTKIQQR